MTLLGECHCMRECCESYYFMFHNNIIFIFVFCLLYELLQPCVGGAGADMYTLKRKMKDLWL